MSAFNAAMLPMSAYDEPEVNPVTGSNTSHGPHQEEMHESIAPMEVKDNSKDEPNPGPIHESPSRERLQVDGQTHGSQMEHGISSRSHISVDATASTSVMQSNVPMVPATGNTTETRHADVESGERKLEPYNTQSSAIDENDNQGKATTMVPQAHAESHATPIAEAENGADNQRSPLLEAGHLARSIEPGFFDDAANQSEGQGDFFDSLDNSVAGTVQREAPAPVLSRSVYDGLYDTPQIDQMNASEPRSSDPRTILPPIETQPFQEEVIAPDSASFFDKLEPAEQNNPMTSASAPAQEPASASFFDELAAAAEVQEAPRSSSSHSKREAVADSTLQARTSEHPLPSIAQAQQMATTDEEEFDLDAELGEFDLEAELGDDFADLDATYETTSSKAATPKPTAPEPAPTAPYVNPYKPSAEAVTAYQPLQQEQQSHVFTPANPATIGRVPSYAPAAVTPYTMSARRAPLQSAKPSAPSFVAGKASYTDPYALPENLVQTKRIRPPAHTLKAAQSVPNLHDNYAAKQRPGHSTSMLRSAVAPNAPPSAPPMARPPTGNRIVSMPQVSQVARQQQLSQQPPRQPPQQPHLARNTDSRYNPALQAAISDQDQPAQLQQQRHSQQAQRPPQRMTPQAGLPIQQASPYAPRPAAVQQPSSAYSRRDSVGSNNSANAQTQHRPYYSPPSTRNTAPGMRSQFASDYQQRHQRGLSGASTSTSDERDHAMGQFLQNQHGAEREMHMDEFSKVAEDIVETQAQQQGKYTDAGQRRQSSFVDQQQFSRQSQDHGGQQAKYLPQQAPQYTAQMPQQQIHLQQQNQQYAPQQSIARHQHPAGFAQPQNGPYAPSELAGNDAGIHQARQPLKSYDPSQSAALQHASVEVFDKPPKALSREPGMLLRRSTEIESQTRLAGQSPDYSKPPPGRHSLDGSRPPKSVMELSRPNSRASSSGRMAMTEPSFSPRPSKVSMYQPGVPVRTNSATQSRTGTMYPMTSGSDANRTLDTPHPKARFAFGGRLVVCPIEQPNAFSHASAIPRPISISAPDATLSGPFKADFIGPLVHGKQNAKQKKSEAQAWFASNSASSQDDNTRLLYRTLALLIEHNGQVLQTPAARSALIIELCPELSGSLDADDSAHFRVPAAMMHPVVNDEGRVLSSQTLTDTSLQRLVELLTRGKQTAALQHACEHRLWSHALLIASRIDGDAWTSVVREFTQAELQEDTEAAQSLSFLYKMLAVRSSSDLAQLGARDFAYGATSWRKSLAMLLANDKQADISLPAFANALMAQEQVLPSLLCQVLLCKPAAVPGSLDAGIAILFGSLISLAAQPSSPDYIAALVCSETVELLVVLAQPKFAGFTQLMPHKLQHVSMLADCGAYNQALRYCEALTATLKLLPRQSQKEASPVQPALIEQLKQRTMQLEALVSDEPSAWLTGRVSKGKMDSIWGSLENKFNKFISGEEAGSEAKIDATPGGGGAAVLGKGPFAHVLPTPTLSRVGSDADLTFGNQMQSSGAPSPVHEIHSYPFAQSGPASGYASPMEGRAGNAKRDASNYAPNQHAPNQQQQRPYSPATGTFQQSQYGAPQGLGLVRQSSYGPDSGHEGYGQAQYDQLQQPAQQAFKAGATRPSSQDVYGQNQQAQQRYAAQQPLHAQSDVTGGYGQPEAPASRYQPTPSSQSQYPPATPQADAAPERPETPAQETQAKETEKATSKTDTSNAAAASPKSTWLGGWFSRKKDSPAPAEQSKPGESPKVHKAKLGEGMSLVYDPVTKKWTNPNGSMPEEKKLSAPPPAAKLKSAMPSGMPPVTSQQPSPSPATPGSAATLPSRPPAARPAVPAAAANPDDALAALLGANTKPRPRRAGAPGATPPTTGDAEDAEGPGQMRSGATMPRRKPRAKARYVDVFSEGGGPAS